MTDTWAEDMRRRQDENDARLARIEAHIDETAELRRRIARDEDGAEPDSPPMPSRPPAPQPDDRGPDRASAHFYRHEFACRCCGDIPQIHATLLGILEDIRAAFGVPVTVTSGYRCQNHNRAVGSSERSQHRTSPLRAADIHVAGVDPLDVLDYCLTRWPDAYGFGSPGYATFTHVDSRDVKARW